MRTLLRSILLLSLLSMTALAACARGEPGPAPAERDACDEYQRVLAVCGAGTSAAARAQREILAESRATPEGRALMTARCEQLVGQRTADPACRARLDARGE